MPLTTAPEVYLSGAWRPTVFDTERTPASIAAGSREMTVRDVQYWYWGITLTTATGAQEQQVCRLLVAGDAHASPPAGSVIVGAGSHATRLRWKDSPEEKEEATGTFTVTA